MSMIAFRADEALKKRLEIIAETKGISLSALIKLYLTQGMKQDLNEVTFSGKTVAEEMVAALEAMAEKRESVAATPIAPEGQTMDQREQKSEIERAEDGGTIYNSAEELLASLENDDQDPFGDHSHL